MAIPGIEASFFSHLQVPGVTESRPSVLRGDHLFALLSSETHQEDSVTYKGFVHKVELDRVKLSFSNRWVLGSLPASLKS